MQILSGKTLGDEVGTDRRPASDVEIRVFLPETLQILEHVSSMLFALVIVLSLMKRYVAMP